MPLFDFDQLEHAETQTSSSLALQAPLTSVVIPAEASGHMPLTPAASVVLSHAASTKDAPTIGVPQPLSRDIADTLAQLDSANAYAVDSLESVRSALRDHDMRIKSIEDTHRCPQSIPTVSAFPVEHNDLEKLTDKKIAGIIDLVNALSGRLFQQRHHALGGHECSRVQSQHAATPASGWEKVEHGRLWISTNRCTL